MSKIFNKKTLNSFSEDQLKVLCNDCNLKDYEQLDKNALIELLVNFDATGGAEAEESSHEDQAQVEEEEPEPEVEEVKQRAPKIIKKVGNGKKAPGLKKPNGAAGVKKKAATRAQRKKGLRLSIKNLRADVRSAILDQDDPMILLHAYNIVKKDV